MKISNAILMASIAINLTTIQINSSNLNLKSQTSSIKLLSGTNFIIENEITDYPGKLITESGATIEGENIIFNDGIFQDNETQVTLSGQLTPTSTNKIILDGNKVLRPEKGDILQSIEISGLGNKISGFAYPQNDILLQDSNTSVTLNTTNELPCNIQLNNGTIFLRKDLDFQNNKRVIGPGIIQCDNYNFVIGSKDLICQEALYFDNNSHVELNASTQLENILTFSGSHNVLSGQSNTISLQSHGAIVVETGSTLTIKNVTLNSVNGSNIRCSDHGGKITFQNVNMILSNDYTFSSGSFEILDDLEITGSFKFIYQSPVASAIKSDASLTLNNKMTFSYDPSTANHNLILFEDETASLIVKEATLHTTTTSMQLTKGNLFTSKNVYFSSEDPGKIILGNNSSSDDLYCEICCDASLIITAGTLSYQNVNDSSWKMLSYNSTLKIYPNTTLSLQQNLNLKSGYATFYGNAILETQVNKDLFGARNYS